MDSPHDRIEAKLGLSSPPLTRLREGPPRVSDHKLVRRIGQGAYGEVWLARNALGTWRAVKVVYRDNFNSDRPYEREFAGIRRFEPLSRAHEGFVDVLQVGRHDSEGWFYYIMELADPADPASLSELEGRPQNYQPRTLSRELHRRGRLPFEESIELGLALSLALGHLHREGLIHRDIKPANIIFVGGFPKLADIGLVTEAARTNTFVGTEGFVPPEGPTSAQADIYALGKVLYEAAMGKDRNEFPEPYTRLGYDEQSLALMELNTILLRACETNPKDRYASAEEMHADLALLHSGGSVKRKHEVERNFRLAKRVGVAAAVVALAAFPAWLWQQHQTEKMTRLASANAFLATEKTKLAEDLARVGAENAERLVRLSVANGIRILDQGDPAGALLWLANALPLVLNPQEEFIHRVRIQQILDQTPRVLRVFPNEASLCSSAFSPDGRFVATGTRDGKVALWSSSTGHLVWGPHLMPTEVFFLRFSRDGKKLLASSSPEQWMFPVGEMARNFFAVLEVESGRELFTSRRDPFLTSTNLTCSHFSADDRWLAVADQGHAIHLYDLETYRQVARLHGHTGKVLYLSFTADGSMLASASLDRTVRIWLIPSGQNFRAPLEQRWPVVRVNFSGDGQHLLTASLANPQEKGEAEFQAWKAATGKPLGKPIAGKGYLAMFVFPKGDPRFLIQDGMRDGTYVYSFASPDQDPQKLDFGPLQCWDFSKDESRLALGNSDGFAQVFDAQTGSALTPRFRHPNRDLTAVLFAPKEQALLAANSAGPAQLWSLLPHRAETSRVRLPGPFQRLGSAETFARFIKTSNPLIPLFLDSPASLRLFNAGLNEQFSHLKSETGKMRYGLRSAPHLNLWASFMDSDQTQEPSIMVLWRPGEQPSDVYLQHPDRVFEAEFTFDDKYFVTYCRDGLFRFWRTSDHQLERTLEQPEATSVYMTAISPDGKTAFTLQEAPLTSARIHVLRFVDLEKGEFIGHPCELPGTAFDGKFSPDGRQLAVLDLEGRVTLIEPRAGRVLVNCIKHSQGLTWVEWSPDQRRLLTAGHDEQVLVWDVATGTQAFGPLNTASGANLVARWSPDGRFIVTRSDVGKTRVWDSSTGEPVTPLLEHSGEVHFAMMASGNRLITGSQPDLLRAWDLIPSNLPNDLLADYAKLLSGRRLTQAGVMLPLTPSELAELNDSLLARAPELFH